MEFLSSLLFGVSASLDALILGVTYGIRKIHIRFWENLVISIITLLGTCLSVGFGAWLGPLLPASLGKWLGSITLMLFGFYYLLKFMITFIKKYLQDPSFAQENAAPPARLQNVLSLGLALSANNISIGLSASMAGLSLSSAAAATFLFSAAFLALGNHLGRRSFSRFLGKAADPISGLLLLGLGLCELFF